MDKPIPYGEWDKLLADVALKAQDEGAGEEMVAATFRAAVMLLAGYPERDRLRIACRLLEAADHYADQFAVAANQLN